MLHIKFFTIFPTLWWSVIATIFTPEIISSVSTEIPIKLAIKLYKVDSNIINSNSSAEPLKSDRQLYNYDGSIDGNNDEFKDHNNSNIDADNHNNYKNSTNKDNTKDDKNDKINENELKKLSLILKPLLYKKNFNDKINETVYSATKKFKKAPKKKYLSTLKSMDKNLQLNSNNINNNNDENKVNKMTDYDSHQIPILNIKLLKAAIKANDVVNSNKQEDHTAEESRLSQIPSRIMRNTDYYDDNNNDDIDDDNDNDDDIDNENNKQEKIKQNHYNDNEINTENGKQIYYIDDKGNNEENEKQNHHNDDDDDNGVNPKQVFYVDDEDINEESEKHNYQNNDTDNNEEIVKHNHYNNEDDNNVENEKQIYHSNGSENNDGTIKQIYYVDDEDNEKNMKINHHKKIGHNSEGIEKQIYYVDDDDHNLSFNNDKENIKQIYYVDEDENNKNNIKIMKNYRNYDIENKIRVPISNNNGNERIQYQIHGFAGPKSYRFGYDTGKGKGRHYRHEQRDNDGNVVGEYGYVDDKGKMTIMKYTAHPKKGFQVQRVN